MQLGVENAFKAILMSRTQLRTVARRAVGLGLGDEAFFDNREPF